MQCNQTYPTSCAFPLSPSHASRTAWNIRLHFMLPAEVVTCSPARSPYGHCSDTSFWMACPATSTIDFDTAPLLRLRSFAVVLQTIPTCLKRKKTFIRIAVHSHCLTPRKRWTQIPIKWESVLVSVSV